MYEPDYRKFTSKPNPKTEFIQYLKETGALDALQKAMILFYKMPVKTPYLAQYFSEYFENGAQKLMKISLLQAELCYKKDELEKQVTKLDEQESRVRELIQTLGLTQTQFENKFMPEEIRESNRLSIMETYFKKLERNPFSHISTSLSEKGKRSISVQSGGTEEDDFLEEVESPSATDISNPVPKDEADRGSVSEKDRKSIISEREYGSYSEEGREFGSVSEGREFGSTSLEGDHGSISEGREFGSMSMSFGKDRGSVSERDRRSLSMGSRFSHLQDYQFLDQDVPELADISTEREGGKEPVKFRMSLWVDKYRPKTLDDLDYHKDMAQNLKHLVKSPDFPHLLVYGPSGAGKRTRIASILRELYGCGAERMRIQRQQFETPSKKKIEITTYSSNYHIEVNPSDVGIQDRFVVQELIKHVAETHPLDQHPFKVIVLQEVDRLSKDAQDALRRTMEKYISSCRLILCALSTSRVTPAIQSRCLPLRVSAPTDNQIVKVLQTVAKKEGIVLPIELADRVAAASNGNLRRAILMLECCRAERYPFVDNQPIVEPDWEKYLRETAFMIVQEQSPQKLLMVRERLYELLSHSIPPDLIFKGLLKELVKNCDNQLKAEICAEAALCQWRSNRGNKAIIHLEEFIAKFMATYKRFIEQAAVGADFFDDF